VTKGVLVADDRAVLFCPRLGARLPKGLDVPRKFALPISANEREPVEQDAVRIVPA
jgi:hypothetical protein